MKTAHDVEKDLLEEMRHFAPPVESAPGAGKVESAKPRLTPERIEELLAQGAANAEALDEQLVRVFVLEARQAGLVLR